MEGRELRDQANLTLTTKDIDVSLSTTAPLDRQERIKIEFYKTYDVMTGIRIAATLGGFFSMMILLVLYKNYCKPNKTLSEEQLNAAVTAAVEEEDRALKVALEATSFYTSLSKQKQLEPEDSPVIISPRFSSIGNGCSNFGLPMRLSYLEQRGKSLPGSVLRFSEDVEAGQTINVGDHEGKDEEEDLNGDSHLSDYIMNGSHLSVPPDRRLSSITSSSADTSYLERRGSAFEMGLPAHPYLVKSNSDKKRLDEEGPWDFYYPIDIQVIQPTPEMSPAVSVETLCEKPNNIYGLQVPGFHEAHKLSIDSSELVIAPLASISTLGSLSTPSSTIQPSTNQSIQKQESTLSFNGDSTGSDSVFLNEEIHTEDEVEEFSTDSEIENGGFDDDYSFCESSKKRAMRCKNPILKLASFDSYETSLGKDTSSEDKEKTKGDMSSLSGDNKKKAETSAVTKRKLSKTRSEPKDYKPTKQLPPWIEKGRSGFVPKRHLSVPASRGKNKARSSLTKEEVQPHSDGCTTNQVVSLPPQGNQTETPPTKEQEEKRKRFQKQKTVNEEWNAENTEQGTSDFSSSKNGDSEEKGKGEEGEE